MKGKERTSNWEAVLGQGMIDYAANDVHCSVMVYKKILAVAAENQVMVTPAAYTTNVTGPTVPKAIAAAPPFASGTATATLVGDQTSTANNASEDSNSRPRPQHMRAYKMWHLHRKPLHMMCLELSRGRPLKESTVISYIVMALQLDNQLPFDMHRLKELVRMDASSWQRHWDWIVCASAEGRGVVL